MSRLIVPAGERVFVGRTSELAAVESCVARASGGEGRTVWIEGVAGSGKSALASRVLDDLPADFVVLRAAADELAFDRPFAVAEQFGLVGGNGAFSAGLEMLTLFAEAGTAGGVAVVVEDLHWADRESRQALLTVARRLDGDRVLLLVTSRPGSAVVDGWDRFCLDPAGCTRVVLGVLSRNEVAEMVSGVGMALTTRAVNRLHTHTGGLALYLRILLSELSLSQLAAPGGDLPVPRSLSTTILARVAELPVEARLVGAALAVVGETVPLSVAGRIAQVEQPAEALEALLATGFVTWWPAEANTPVGFVHPLYREALYADLSPTRRRELHRAAAAMLEAGSALGHRVAAADGVDDNLADELVEAAKRESDRGAQAVAARYLLWASPLSSRRPLGEHRLLRAARLLVAEGNVPGAAELRGRVEGCGDGPLRSLVLGQLAWQEGEAAVAERWLVNATRFPAENGDDGEVLAAALGRLGLLYYTQGRAEEAIDAGTRLSRSTR
jgi:predicted kinase